MAIGCLIVFMASGIGERLGYHLPDLALELQRSVLVSILRGNRKSAERKAAFGHREQVPGRPESVARPPDDEAEESNDYHPPCPHPACPCCGGPIIVIEAFARWRQPRSPPLAIAPICDRVP